MTTKAKPTDDNLRMIATDIIALNPANPRTDMGDLSELEASIRSHGIIQPILVRPVDGMYMVVAGSRRFAAAHRIGMGAIPCHVQDMDDDRAMELAIAENIVRKDMSALDEIRAVGELAASGESHAEIAARFGRTPRWVATRAKIARMPERVLELIGEGSLKVSEAEELAKLHVSHVEELAERASSGNMGLRWVREQVYEALRAIAGVPWTVGECSRCILRSDKQTHLFEGGGKDAPARCMDSDCWADKRAAWIAKTEKELRAKGHMPKHAFQSAHHFEHYFGSILNPADDSEMEQIGELQAAGVKERYFVNPDDGEILLRWDWSDIPEKTVKTSSGDDAKEGEEDADDFDATVRQVCGSEEDEPSEPTVHPAPSRAPWEMRRGRIAAISDALFSRDWNHVDSAKLLAFLADAYRINCHAPRLDKLYEDNGDAPVFGLGMNDLKRAVLADIVKDFYAATDCGNDTADVAAWQEFKDAFGIEESEEVTECQN